MKKAQFKKLKVGDIVYLKSSRKITNMKEWDGRYFEDSQGCYWARFFRNGYMVRGEGATVLHLPEYHKDVITVRCHSEVFKIPRKCIKNF